MRSPNIRKRKDVRFPTNMGEGWGGGIRKKGEFNKKVGMPVFFTAFECKVGLAATSTCNSSRKFQIGESLLDNA